MGRPVKSIDEHKLHDTRSQSKAAAESHVRAGRPKFPKDIRNDPVLRVVFKGLVKLLGERRSLSEGDCELIRLYCFVYDRHQRNVAALRQEGEVTTYTVLDSNGQPTQRVKENIRLKFVAAAEKQMAAILNQLGLTPTAKDRARPTSGTAPSNDVVPGSLADMHPEWLKGDNVMEFVPPAPLTPEPEEGDGHE